MLRNKRGFTLVELLAVIVILAIILAIAIPSVSSILSTAKKGSFDSDAKMLVKALSYQQAQAMIGTAAVTVLDDTTIYSSGTCTGSCSAANITALGSDSSNYDIVRIVNTSPLTICVESKSTSKFGAYSVKATASTIADITAGTCSGLTN
jgi:type IV pilus assembly protein PilA